MRHLNGMVNAESVCWLANACSVTSYCMHADSPAPSPETDAVDDGTSFGEFAFILAGANLLLHQRICVWYSHCDYILGTTARTPV